MTDRLAPYAMIPSFNTSLIQQQQQLSQAQQAQQQSQQPQMDPQQARQGFIKPDQRQMWQQMHQQQSQPAFRTQTTSDISNSPQLAEFLRSQQQGMNRPNDSQSPPFPSNNAPMAQQQPHANFISASNPQSSLPFGTMQALNNPAARNTLMSSNNQGQMRQLELLQQHPGHTNNFSRVPQQQGVLNPSANSQNVPSDTFVAGAPGGPNSSPALQAKSQTAQSGQHQPPGAQLVGQTSGLPAGRRPMTLLELNERARQVKEQINNLESMAMQLTQQRPGMSDAAYMQKMQFIVKETQSRKEYLQKVAHAATQQFGNAGGATTLNSSPLNMANGTPAQPVQGNTAAWMSQINGAKGSNFASPTGNSQNAAVNIRSMPGGIPASGTQQHPNGQRIPSTGAQMSFDTNSQPVPAPGTQSSAVNLSQIVPTPLEKSKFENAYQNFCKTKNVTLNPRLMMIDNRSIDLHALHVQIMSEGGAAKVNANDLWPVVGARLGFVQFPGTEKEPAKSGPGVAQQLAHIYKEYLATFDQIYMQSLVEARRKMLQQSHVQINGRGLTPTQMQAMLSYASIPAEQLRGQGVSDQVIRFVEANRPSLQQRAAEQLNFRGQLRPPSGGPQPSDLDRAASTSTYTPSNPSAPGRVTPLMPGSTSQPSSNANLGTLAQQAKPESMQSSIALIARLEQEYALQLSQLRPQEIPNDARMEFNNLLEQVHRLSTEMRPKLPMLYMMMRGDDSVRRLVQVITTAQYQRNLLSSNPPKYILNMDMLRSMLASVQRHHEHFQQIIHHHKQQLASSTSDPPRPPAQTITSQSISQPPQHPTLTANRSNSMQGPPKKAVPVTSPAPPSAASPPPSTPATNAPTPSQVAASPPPPKSPKAKGTPKPAPKKARRASKAQPPITNQPASTSTPNTQPEEPSPSAPSPTGSLKRPRDDPPNAPSPSGIKRPKTDPDSPVAQSQSSEAPPTNKVDASAIKTEEEASAFFEQMSELIRIASDNDPQESLSTDISDTLDMILKGCSGDEKDHARSLPSLEFPELSSSSHINPINEFPEFIDLSSYGGPEDDNAAFKVSTPDLIPSSSANPSPESASSDSDVACKLEDTSDPLRLGIWKEIDGGESAYYTQQGDWKWESPMPSSEQAWAIFTGS